MGGIRTALRASLKVKPRERFMLENVADEVLDETELDKRICSSSHSDWLSKDAAITMIKISGIVIACCPRARVSDSHGLGLDIFRRSLTARAASRWSGFKGTRLTFRERRSIHGICRTEYPLMQKLVIIEECHRVSNAERLSPRHALSDQPLLRWNGSSQKPRSGRVSKHRGNENHSPVQSPSFRVFVLFYIDSYNRIHYQS